ncbi:MAG: FkbM family methyltransferase [Sphingobacteriaceae bacterium]|nr:FkbM family methyltransferase [Sphingobacteriaceae bacterium]
MLKKANLTNFISLGVEPELLILPFFIKPDEIFIDIGANKGSYIFSALQFLKPNHIVAFEPNPILAKRLSFVFRKVIVFQKALASTPGEGYLTIPFTENQADDCLANLKSQPDENNAHNYKVKITTLDETVKQLKNNNIGLIKIDVEGNELNVLEGALKTVTKLRPVLIIEIENRQHENGIQEIISRIESDLNYKAFYYSILQNRLIEYNPDSFLEQKMEDYGSLQYVNNFIFVPTENDALLIIGQVNSKIEKARK